ncbi:MAG: phage shock protein A, partial [Chitinivibrionales bacterium]|nr:phage shock protein A [Chitinivibrionales bacterium]
MGVFTRFKDIIGSNINAMLDRAEDPEKMIRLMIQEMEETLVEMKAACASQIADRMRLERELETLGALVAKWDERARLAVEKGRDDLAREALLEKQRYEKVCEDQERELERFKQLIDSSQADIARLEDKIVSARKKQRLLVQRHLRAERKLHAEKAIRRSTVGDAALKFEQYEH